MAKGEAQRVLYFRLGDQDRIGLGTFIGLLSNIRGLLQDFDAAISKDPRGQVRWEVAKIEKRSPVLLGLFGEPIRRRQSRYEPDPLFPHKVGKVVIGSAAKITNSAERLDVVSDAAMDRFKDLATRSKKLGPITMWDDETEVEISEDTLHNIHKLTGQKTRSVGSILGTLEMISVHKANEIRVWDDNSNRPIRCTYESDLEETVKAALRQRVLVSGVVGYNISGQPVSVKVRDLMIYPKDSELPTIDEVIGSVPGITGGESLAKHMRLLRDDE